MSRSTKEIETTHTWSIYDSDKDHSFSADLPEGSAWALAPPSLAIETDHDTLK